jgi:hypothetical protein
MNAPSRTRRVRFTLLNLVLLLTTAAAAVGLFAAYRRIGETASRYQRRLAAVQADLAEVRAANKQLREEGGFLTVEDPSQLYAIRLRERQPRTWTYRVHLPPGRNYVVAAQVNRLPPQGQPPEFSDGGNLPSVNTISGGNDDSVATGLAPGQYLLTLEVSRQSDDQWTYSLDVRGSGANNRELKRAGSQIALDDAEWPATEHSFGFGGVNPWQSEHNPQQTLVLLDGRAFGNQPGDSSANSAEGAMMWIQPNPAASGDHETDAAADRAKD